MLHSSQQLWLEMIIMAAFGWLLFGILAWPKGEHVNASLEWDAQEWMMTGNGSLDWDLEACKCLQTVGSINLGLI